VPLIGVGKAVAIRSSAMGDAMNEVKRMLRDTRGAVTTEYVAVVGLVAVGFIAAMIAAGPKMVEGYQRTRNVVASPFP
jgi:Flp pilus assembly pilin Flp